MAIFLNEYTQMVLVNKGKEKYSFIEKKNPGIFIYYSGYEWSNKAVILYAVISCVICNYL